MSNETTCIVSHEAVEIAAPLQLAAVCVTVQATHSLGQTGTPPLDVWS